MRLLVLSNTPFLPASAGNRERIHRMLAWLGARGWEVGVLLLPDADLAEWDVAGMRRAVARLEVATPPAAGAGARLGRAVGRALAAGRRRAGLGPAPLGLDDWCPPWFRARAAAEIRAWAPDAVLVEYVFLSACLVGLDEAGARPVTAIDTHDLMHRRAACYAAAGVPLQWFHTTRARERRGLARADLVLAIGDEEAAVLREMVPERTVLTVPPARPVTPAPLADAAPGRLLLAASRNDLNVAGLRWFLDAVWPALGRALPGVELVVCGTVCEKVREAPAGVVLRGFVPSLAAEYACVRVVLDPAPAGTGLAVKVVEALCHGRPVVARRFGARGVAPDGTDGVVLADGPAEFAAAVRALVEDDGRWRRLAAAAASYAEHRLSPDAVFGPLDRHLGTAGRRPPG